MQDDKPFASLGTMSPQMRALAISQDTISWQKFMEGYIPMHFYFITHLQWIYRNFALHDKLCRYLHNMSLEDIRVTIDELAETSPKDVPEESKFLLKINFGNLTKSHIKSQQY